MEQWNDMTLVHKGERVVIDGIGFSAIGRLEFLRLLEARAASAGIEPRYATRIGGLGELSGFDLVVAADGVNSLLRSAGEPEFGTTTDFFRNKFIWFGAERTFPTLTQTFIESEFGAFNAHHYRYSPSMSTFIVECGPETFARAGFAEKSPEESRAICARLFAATLEGAALISNKSVWRDFPWIWNERWHIANVVLLGDALHTAHFSIGSGTRLALEDAIALAKALEAEPTTVAALSRYQRERRPVVEKIVKASRTSAAWYETFSEKMQLSPAEFAMSYITRSGRVDKERLRRMSPRFMASYEGRPR
jgi:2-polyprenyl-6-methoxyphenol hydroxylase-like FAD-dependent oxidoreductase